MILLFKRIYNLNIPLDLQLKLFVYIGLRILTYTCEVWCYENLDMIEQIHNGFLRKVTFARNNTPLYTLYGENRDWLDIGINSVIVRLLKLLFSYINVCCIQRIPFQNRCCISIYTKTDRKARDLALSILKPYHNP